MASSIFYQFHVHKCVVDDELLDYFLKAGWGLNVNDNQFFTKYKWPDIKLSKLIIEFLDDDLGNNRDHEFAIELLGCYQLEKDYTEEGTVILYYEKIKSAAERYIDETRSTTSLEIVIDRLTTIVLIHELVHWLIHYVSPGVCNKIPVGTRYNKFDELEFHEGFAQIFTHWFANNKGGLYLDIFSWLVKKQPPQYHAYTKLLSIGVKTHSHAITLMRICKLLDIQSMDKALKIAEIYPCKDWATFEKSLFEPFKFNALLSCLDYKEKKHLFKYLVCRKSGMLSSYLKTNNKNNKSILRLILVALFDKEGVNSNLSIDEIVTILDLSDFGFEFGVKDCC
jgi:hypothetical protein